MAIDLISVRQFKCFSSADLPLAALTILSGFNAAGKSTALQSLLLVTQGLRTSPTSKFLPLNGPLVRLGTAGDVVRQGRRGLIEFGVDGFGTSLRWELAADSASGRAAKETGDEVVEGDEGEPDRLEFVSVADNAEPGETPAPGRAANEIDREIVEGDEGERGRLELISVSVNGKSVKRTSGARIRPIGLVKNQLLTAIRGVIFLGATRNGQLDVYPSPDEAVPVHADVGHEGQFAPWWYVRTADNLVLPKRMHPDDQSVTVRAQVDAWLSHLFPGAAANSEALPGTGLSRLVFKMHRRGAWSRPANIGYGLSYAFPLVVALLNARPGQVVVVDSPEAHLHPRAQSRMGQMLAFFAAAGVQILVETHSDHILSGARLSVRRGVIEPEAVSIHFFSGRASDEDNGIISPLVDRDGYLSAWPEGFFDQADADLAALAQPS